VTHSDWEEYWVRGRQVLIQYEGHGIRATQELAELLGIKLYRPYQVNDWVNIELTDRHKTVLMMLQGQHKHTILKALRARKGVPDEPVE